MATAARLSPLLLLLLLLFSALAARQGEARLVAERCLNCICEANGCSMEKVCVGDFNCGPFHMSKGFWLDGGQPVIPGDLPTDLRAFERCAEDPFCSADAVEGYMKKFGKDCNSDGSVDCVDFALIHHHGPAACNGDSTVEPIRKFSECWKSHTERVSKSTVATLPN